MSESENPYIQAFRFVEKPKTSKIALYSLETPILEPNTKRPKMTSIRGQNPGDPGKETGQKSTTKNRL
ncbi:MAG: hypothetical protein AAGN35_24340 [Bacteroidota bacterium]